MLIVEDNATNRLIAGRLLEAMGAVVETAEDGVKGVEVVERGDRGFDLIFMDIQMPGLDGIEATRRIRDLGGQAATTPIVAMTANALAHQQASYIAAGMNGAVAKPLSPAALVHAIVAALGDAALRTGRRRTRLPGALDLRTTPPPQLCNTAARFPAHESGAEASRAPCREDRAS